MGISPFSSSSCSCSRGGATEVYKKLEDEQETPTPKDRNPNPKNYTIKRLATRGSYLIAEIVYPDCTNFEGRKILVFAGITSKRLRRSGFIDPHFCDRRHISPVARFEPTVRGWELAELMCKGGTQNA